MSQPTIFKLKVSKTGHASNTFRNFYLGGGDLGRTTNLNKNSKAPAKLSGGAVEILSRIFMLRLFEGWFSCSSIYY